MTQVNKGLEFARHFSYKDRSPFDYVVWTKRDAIIYNGKGEVIFEQKGVEAPESWSQTAVNIVASKYFAGKLGSPEREYSVKSLIDRVAHTITNYGSKNGYYDTHNALVFYEELVTLLVNQMVAFNSPVWFNVGTTKTPYGWKWDPEEKVSKPVDKNDKVSQQVSACFLNSVEDSMESILDLAKTEGMLFKFGSGSGVNLSPLREEGAALGPGGTSSGPLSFAKGLDSFAGAIKSGGTTRRAAKLLCLNVDHPDIEKFIWCKAKEEKKAHDLISLGYDSSIDGEAYQSIFYQNANNSVRVTDDFMQQVEKDGYWDLISRVDGSVKKTIKAKDLLRQIAEATWQCGDPGMMFDTTANKWHTCKATGRINTANPCIEFQYLDDTACNLASFNLMKFLKEDGTFDVNGFKKAVYIVITAMEILVGLASYPTARIAENSYKYRPLGLGFANLGSLLMCSGLPYDSEEGRLYAGLITALMLGQAYLTSADLAGAVGSFEGYKKNKSSFDEVISMHRKAAQTMFWKNTKVDQDLYSEIDNLWASVETTAEIVGGYRNGQTVTIAPTGTIGFMMDCDTTGIEPELGLTKYKKMVGGGYIQIINSLVPKALYKMGYSPEEIDAIVAYISEKGTVEGAPLFRDEHLPVFDCSFKPQNGTRFIKYDGHLKMMAAVQPFVSGAISKTINMPEAATVEDISKAYFESWKLGLKAVAIYRDNSKGVQPLNLGKDKKEVPVDKITEKIVYLPVRTKLPDERDSITHKFDIGGHEGYITVGKFPDGKPGEIFITMAKEGSTISGLMDSFATAVSYCLQYGVPLKFLVDKFGHSRFEPSGWTGNSKIPYAKSIPDYIFRWMASKFEDLDIPVGEVTLPEKKEVVKASHSNDALCSVCGSLMTPNGSCFKCENCGGTSGCS